MMRLPCLRQTSRDITTILEPPEISFDGNRHEIIHDSTTHAMDDLYDEYELIFPILTDQLMLT